MSDEPQPPMSARDSRKQAKSDLAAAKARAKAERPIWKKPLVWVGAVILLLIIGSVAGGGGTGDPINEVDQAAPALTESVETEPAPTEAPEPEPEESPAAPAPAPAPSPEPAPEPSPAAPDLTSGQENAIRAAADYLDYSGFSREGLIQQLEFEDYSTEDATFAVDFLNVNWKKQAAKVAKDYLDYSPFSREGLIEQLMFDGFTRKQATYGADQALK